ncbi:hypothetical protein [Candidatus Amarobacter glycogenicus]|uniref:hypothetical protein n=1 Tax=Candidatus Amarobacter glycogenicus TaxID=3140699 RepID=UPI002A157D35|nr:hypothetical protein [Dehalococcoidia bacterium]
MRRFFSRSSPSELAAPDLSRDCAHGCPACPHPGAFFEFDDEGASTLLPADRLLLDGGTLELHSAAVVMPATSPSKKPRTSISTSADPNAKTARRVPGCN